jgi:hypothetical protein
MKIKQLDEYKYNIVTKGEKGVNDTIHAQASASNKLRQAAANKAKVDNPYAQNASNAPSGASPGSQTTSDASKRNRTDPTLGDPTDKERAASKAKINAIRGDNKPAAGTKPGVSTATKTKKPPVSASGALVATGAGIGIGAATQKKDSPDASKGGSATAGDATGDDTVGKSKNSPFYVPPDNASRENKPFPPDSRYGKEDAAKAAADAAKATSTQSSSAYKGSQGSQAIQALNPEIADVNKIRTGQELKMPDGSTYTVKKGDALDRIARNAGISPKTTPAEKPAAEPDPNRFSKPNVNIDPTAKSEPAAPAEPKVYAGAPASVDTRDGTGDNDKETSTRDYSSGRPVDKELDDKYGTGNTRTADDGRTYVRQKGVMGQPDSEQRSYASFGDFFNKIRGKGDVNGKVADEVQESSELNTIKKLSSITESKITQVDNNMDLRKLLAIMSETKMADLKGKKHGGSYGNSYDTDEEGEDKPAAKKSRGGQESDSTKDSKKWQGADDAADAIIGGKAPKKEVGTKSVKHSIKEWMQAVEQETLQEGAKPDFLDMDKDGDKKEPMKKAVADKKTVKEEDVSEELKGGQKKIDKNKNGKLDSEDFKMLRKNKVDEGVNLHKMMTEKQTKVDEMLEELQQEIAEFKTTGEMGDKLRDALDLHTYSKGETLIGEGDQELADKFHDEDMIRLGDEGKADAQHMQDLDRTRDESTADLWRMKDLARDSTMGRADAISLREEDHAQGDTVYHRGQIGIVDRIEGNKCFVHKPNGDMDVWPTEECSKKKQGAFDMFKKDVQDVGAGFGRFLKGKSELDESPFAFESKKAKVEEEDQPKLKTKITDTGTETTSSTGRIKATFEPGKETKVEPVKESMAYERNNMPPKDLDGLERWAAGSSNRRHFSLVAKFGIINDMNLQQTLEVLQNFDDEDYASQYGASEESGNALYNSIALFNAYENVYDAWIPPDFDYNEPESVTWDEDYTGKRAGIKESFVYDVWNHQLEKMINESLTVTTTKGDNGTDDSVSVTASGSDASDIMAILRNAGIGSMGAEEEHMDHPTSAYGAPEGEAVGVVQIDGPEVIDGDDTMLGLMKKIADINNGHEEGHEGHMDHGSSEDYADENCDQEEVDEGNAFTGALKDTPKGEEFEVDGKKYTDNSSLEEGNATCNECGMNEGECEHTKMVEGADDESAEVGLEEDADGAEYANSDDDQSLQDIKFMTNYITGGINGQKTMHRHGYQNGDNPLAMRESTDPIAQWKKLSGLS